MPLATPPTLHRCHTPHVPGHTLPARWSYVHDGTRGRYLRQKQAQIAMLDRGYHFGDGVYEVIAYTKGHLLHADAHWQRLQRSLRALHIALPMPVQAMTRIIQELCRRNQMHQGAIYLQMTRGIANTRHHLFPTSPTLAPTLTLLPLTPPPPKSATKERGVEVRLAPDIRWGRCDIKSLNLLPNLLEKNAAAQQGLAESWLYNQKGDSTECSASNSFVVDATGTLRTHPANQHILGGITRHHVLELAQKQGIAVREEAFPIRELGAAKEAFITSTTARLTPVVKIGETQIGTGKPGPITAQLIQAYDAHIQAQLTKQEGGHA